MIIVYGSVRTNNCITRMNLGCAVNYRKKRSIRSRKDETGCVKSTELPSFRAQLLPAVHEWISFRSGVSVLP